jgi:hypothetical protein
LFGKFVTPTLLQDPPAPIAHFARPLEGGYGINMAYPGGIIIFTDDARGAKKGLKALFEDIGIPCFFTEAGSMSPEDNEKPGVEIIIDGEGIVGQPRLFGTLIKNNIFMLVRMKMNMGSTGFGHSNILITTADPQKIAEETSASLKSFHAMKAYCVSGKPK